MEIDHTCRRAVVGMVRIMTASTVEEPYDKRCRMEEGETARRISESVERIELDSGIF